MHSTPSPLAFGPYPVFPTQNNHQFPCFSVQSLPLQHQAQVQPQFVQVQPNQQIVEHGNNNHRKDHYQSRDLQIRKKSHGVKARMRGEIYGLKKQNAELKRQLRR